MNRTTTKDVSAGSLQRTRVAVVGAIFLVLSGVGYRLAASALGAAISERVKLPRPIKVLPMQIDSWSGKEVELSEAVQRVAGNDDYVNRLYQREGTGEIVGLYVAYTGRPSTMLGHRPTVCYPKAGHSYLGTENISLHYGSTEAPAMVHSFFKPGVVDTRTVVLNYYVLGGHITADENSFWSLGWRSPNLARDANHYVAQIQVTTLAELDTASARRRVIEFAEASLPQIISLLPRTSASDGN